MSTKTRLRPTNTPHHDDDYYDYYYYDYDYALRPTPYDNGQKEVLSCTSSSPVPCLDCS